MLVAQQDDLNKKMRKVMTNLGDLSLHLSIPMGTVNSIRYGLPAFKIL